MIVEIKVPSPGESINEVVIASWLVKNGDYVEKNKEIAEIESDKATLQLVATQSGTIELKAAAGETVEVGQIVCHINTDAHKLEVVQNTAPEVVEKQEFVAQKPLQNLNETQNTDFNKVKITPLAKQLMAENNLSIEEVLNGLRKITKSDIENVVENKKIISENAPEKQLNTQPEEPTKVVKMTSLRKKLSERLVAVKNETAMLTTFNEVDMSAIMKLRNDFQKSFVDKFGFKLGFMAFFIKAASIALTKYPEVNAMIDGENIVYHNYTNIGIAVQSPKGLMVPVIKNVENLSLANIELTIKDFAEKSKNNKITLNEMLDGTFTVTNGGTFGSLLSTPIINPPQSAILGMHNILDRPIALNGSVAIRPMMYIALSYDHRLIDGKSSVGFLVTIKKLIENPLAMLFDSKSPEETLLDL